MGWKIPRRTVLGGLVAFVPGARAAPTADTAHVCSKLMVIRHAEKPKKKAAIGGVDEAGVPDDRDLTAKGWQRAGALVRFFKPSSPKNLQPGLAVPGAIFATKPTEESPSMRPLQTVTPLATDLGLQIREFTLDQEGELIAAAVDAAPAVLICWHHEHIPDLAAQLGIKFKWPDDEMFDLVLVFDSAGDEWKLSVMPQHLLPGDT
jgi:hypothetical protein